MKIVVLDGFSANSRDLSWSGLEALGALTVYDRTPRELILERMAGAQAVIINKIPMGEEVFSRCPELKYLGLLSTGYNIVDLEAASAHGVAVCNVPGYSTHAVVQHTFALLLELCMHAGLHSQAVRDGKWSACEDFCFREAPLTELYGKTMGLVGLGAIGSNVAKTALCLGMKVIACASRPRDDSGIPGVEMTDLEGILRRSDIISLHCPLTAENSGMISATAIEKMKDGVMIINTARGGLINEPDLAAALKSGKVAGFGADVLAKEPPSADCPLIGALNTVITPHIAWAPLETRRRLMDIVAENLRLFMEGRPQNVVNPQYKK